MFPVRRREEDEREDQRDADKWINKSDKTPIRLAQQWVSGNRFESNLRIHVLYPPPYPPPTLSLFPSPLAQSRDNFLCWREVKRDGREGWRNNKTFSMMSWDW